MYHIITALVEHIEPFDALEREHITLTLNWIGSGAPLWRIQKPALPPMHLVSYFVLIDLAANHLLLVDHKLAGLWLPGGGHVEGGEHPTDTVRREVREELGIEAHFLVERPLFITVTQTIGQTAGHTDVSLWYVLHGELGQNYAFDHNEFHQIAWFPIAHLPLDRADPHLGRFAAKLEQVLDA